MKLRLHQLFIAIFSLTCLTSYGQNNATFEEAIDFIDRYADKHFREDEQEFKNWTIKVVNLKTYSVEAYYEHLDDLGYHLDIDKSTYSFTMKNLDPDKVYVRKNSDGNNWMVVIHCKNDDCMEDKVINEFKRDRQSQMRSRTDYFRWDYLKIPAEDEETAQRIKNAVLHAIKLSGEEKF